MVPIRIQKSNKARCAFGLHCDWKYVKVHTHFVADYKSLITLAAHSWNSCFKKLKWWARGLKQHLANKWVTSRSASLRPLDELLGYCYHSNICSISAFQIFQCKVKIISSMDASVWLCLIIVSIWLLLQVKVRMRH